MLASVLSDWGGVPVSPMEVYRDIFRLGEGYLQVTGEDPGEYKANPVGYYRNWSESSGHRRIFFEDTFESVLEEMQEADFAILNGLSYFGRRNVQSHASKMFALIIDLDGVTEKTLNAFLSGTTVDAYPLPSYIVLSGNGVHLYFKFDGPVELYPNIKLQLKEFKHGLIDKIWNKYTSTLDAKQYQGINQGFRVIGGRTKAGAEIERTVAYKFNSHPFTLDSFKNYVPEGYWVDDKKIYKESKMTMEEARDKYPEWYEAVVVNKAKYKSRWKIEEKVNGGNPYALYDWWKRQIYQSASFGHRYFCVMCLAIYAVKCSVPYDKLQKDAEEMIPFLNAINPDEPFTERDVKSALESYDLRYCTFPLRDICRLADIEVAKNKRNGRTREQHTKIMRAIRDALHPDGSWRKGGGRPLGSGTKKQMVLDYFEENPNASGTAAARELGISKTTVYKYKPRKMV